MLSPPEVIERLCFATALGAAIGIERERLTWVAGLRTHMLVCIGSALIIIVSTYGFDEVVSAYRVVLDPSRMCGWMKKRLSGEHGAQDRALAIWFSPRSSRRTEVVADTESALMASLPARSQTLSSSRSLREKCTRVLAQRAEALVLRIQPGSITRGPCSENAAQ